MTPPMAARLPRHFAVEHVHIAKGECAWALVCPMTAGTVSLGRIKASVLVTNVMSVEYSGCAKCGAPKGFQGLPRLLGTFRMCQHGRFWHFSTVSRTLGPMRQNFDSSKRGTGAYVFPF